MYIPELPFENVHCPKDLHHLALIILHVHEHPETYGEDYDPQAIESFYQEAHAVDKEAYPVFTSLFEGHVKANEEKEEHLVTWLDRVVPALYFS